MSNIGKIINPEDVGYESDPNMMPPKYGVIIHENEIEISITWVWETLPNMYPRIENEFHIPKEAIE